MPSLPERMYQRFVASGHGKAKTGNTYCRNRGHTPWALYDAGEVRVHFAYELNLYQDDKAAFKAESLQIDNLRFSAGLRMPHFITREVLATLKSTSAFPAKALSVIEAKPKCISGEELVSMISRQRLDSQAVAVATEKNAYSVLDLTLPQDMTPQAHNAAKDVLKVSGMLEKLLVT